MSPSAIRRVAGVALSVGFQAVEYVCVFVFVRDSGGPHAM